MPEADGRTELRAETAVCEIPEFEQSRPINACDEGLPEEVKEGYKADPQPHRPMGDMRSVSYTHLTLPTILLV